MSDPKYLPAFSAWLRAMGEDVLSLANQLEAADAPVPIRQASAEALSYLRRLAELIPEGLEPLGYLEVAFAFRVVAERALADDSELARRGPSGDAPPEGELPGGELPSGEVAGAEVAGAEHPDGAALGRLARLAADAGLVGEFLGDDLPHFRELVLAPVDGERGSRPAPALLEDLELQGPFLREVREWAEQYRAPELGDGEEELVKIGSFFRTRLRRAS